MACRPAGTGGSRLRTVSKRCRHGKTRSALPAKRHMERATDRFRRMASGNAFPAQDRKRHFQRKILRLSLVDRASGKKCLCRDRRQRQRDLCGSKREDRRGGVFLLPASGAGSHRMDRGDAAAGRAGADFAAGVWRDRLARHKKGETAPQKAASLCDFFA